MEQNDPYLIDCITLMTERGILKNKMYPCPRPMGAQLLWQILIKMALKTSLWGAAPFRGLWVKSRQLYHAQ